MRPVPQRLTNLAFRFHTVPSSREAGLPGRRRRAPPPLDPPQFIFAEPEVVSHFVQQGGADLAAHFPSFFEMASMFLW